MGLMNDFSKKYIPQLKVILAISAYIRKQETKQGNRKIVGLSTQFKNHFTLNLVLHLRQTGQNHLRFYEILLFNIIP